MTRIQALRCIQWDAVAEQGRISSNEPVVLNFLLPQPMRLATCRNWYEAEKSLVQPVASDPLDKLIKLDFA